MIQVTEIREKRIMTKIMRAIASPGVKISAASSITGAELVFILSIIVLKIIAVIMGEVGRTDQSKERRSHGEYQDVCGRCSA